MLTHKDYYATLRVKKAAAQEDIREAFRTAARRYHPDVHPGDKRAEEKFKEISAAYDVLSDEKKRKIYDQFGFYSDQIDPAQAEAYPRQQSVGGRPKVNLEGFGFSSFSSGVPGLSGSSIGGSFKGIFSVGLSRGGRMRVGRLLLLALFVVVVAWGARTWYRNEKAKKAESVATREHTAASERAIADLRSRYKPVTDWPQEMEGKTFTIDVQPIFVRPDHRPVLFFTMLQDIRADENGRVLLYFMTIQKGPQLRLILDCAGCDLQALKKSAQSVDDLAVVAQITAAQSNLDLSDEAPPYVLNGRLLDAREIGLYDESKTGS